MIRPMSPVLPAWDCYLWHDLDFPLAGEEIVLPSLFVFRLDKGKTVEAWSNGTVTGLN